MTTVKRFAVLFAALLTLTVGTAANAAAQRNAPATTESNPGEWSVTPFFGFGFSGDLDGPAGVLGVAGGYDWNSNISFEGELSVLPASENERLVDVQSRAFSLTGNLLYHFEPRPFRPYGVFGIGFGHSGVDELSLPKIPNPNGSSNRAVVDFGGGVERSIRENIQVRGDFRYFFGGDLVPDYWRLSVGLKCAVFSR